MRTKAALFPVAQQMGAIPRQEAATLEDLIDPARQSRPLHLQPTTVRKGWPSPIERASIMRHGAMLFNLAVVGLLVYSAHARTGDDRIKSVDVDKIRAHRTTRFIEKLFWPSETLIAEKKISKELVPEDMREFKDMLKTVLRPEYAVAPEVVDANAIAVEEPRPKDSNDYVLLEYTCNKRQIKVQDGRALWITVLPDANVTTGGTDIAQYVKTTAFEMLNMPKSDEDGKEPNVYVATLDIGGSHWGNIVYAASYPPPVFWYSHMGWWSDGRNIMFLIGKGRFHNDQSATEKTGADGMARAIAKRRREAAGPSADQLKPRKFRKKAEPDNPP